MAHGGHKRLTLDIDSSLIEADKKEAQKTYKGFNGYNPLLAWLDEPYVFLSGVFRPGNSSPQGKWQLVVRGEETFLLAETIHVPGGCTSRPLPALKLIVTKKLSGQLELFKDPIKHRAIIVSLPETMSTLEVLDHHNDRGRMEKAIGELKDGFGCYAGRPSWSGTLGSAQSRADSVRIKITGRAGPMRACGKRE